MSKEQSVKARTHTAVVDFFQANRCSISLFTVLWSVKERLYALNIKAKWIKTLPVRQNAYVYVHRTNLTNQMSLRSCLHGGGGPQVCEVTRLAVVEKWPAFTCKLTTPGSRGDVTRRCCVVAGHVNSENGRRTTHFGGQCSFLLIICSRCNISVLWLFTVTFDEFGALWRACKCNMNSTPAGRVTPP